MRMSRPRGGILIDLVGSYCEWDLGKRREGAEDILFYTGYYLSLWLNRRV